MKTKKINDLDMAEELGKKILRIAQEDKKEILKKVDEDI